MNDINGNDNLSQKDLDDLALLGVNETEDTEVKPFFKHEKNTRLVITSIAGFCAGGVTSKLIKQHVATNSKFGKVELAIGAFCISGIVAVKSEKYIGAHFDAMTNALRDAFTEEV